MHHKKEFTFCFPRRKSKVFPPLSGIATMGFLLVHDDHLALVSCDRLELGDMSRCGLGFAWRLDSIGRGKLQCNKRGFYSRKGKYVLISWLL